MDMTPNNQDIDENGLPPERLGKLLVDDNRIAKINGLHTKIVRVLRYALPLLALVMIIIIVTWNDAGKHIAPPKKEALLPQSQNIQNELVNPVFNSVDDKNQPYKITADKAIQSKSSPDVMELINPVGLITQEDKSTLSGGAKTGLYEQKTKKLNLQENVVLKHSNGYTLNTQELRVDMSAKRAFSGKDILVSGPAGTLEAKGLEGDFEGGTIIFTGPARIVLYSDGSFLNPHSKANPKTKGQNP